MITKREMLERLLNRGEQIHRDMNHLMKHNGLEKLDLTKLVEKSPIDSQIWLRMHKRSLRLNSLIAHTINEK